MDGQLSSAVALQMKQRLPSRESKALRVRLNRAFVICGSWPGMLTSTVNVSVPSWIWVTLVMSVNEETARRRLWRVTR